MLVGAFFAFHDSKVKIMFQMVLVRCPNLSLSLMGINDHAEGSPTPPLKLAGTDVLEDL